MNVKKAGIIAAALCLAAALAACAPQENSEPAAGQDGGEGGGAAVQVEWSMDSDCATCHADEQATMTDSACPAAIHEAQGLSCIDCHDDEAGLAQAHAEAGAGASTPSRLTVTEVSSAVCEECHDPAALAETTAASAVLTDSNGTVVNPHAVPESEDHASLECGSCHQMHSDRPIDRTAAAACGSCHHAGVYECYTCHE